MPQHLSIQNYQGLGLVQIKPFALGDYLFTDKPNVVSWYDCRGSVGKYVGLLHETDEAQLNIVEALRAALNSGKNLDLNTFATELRAFCSVFPAGELHLRTYEEADYASQAPQNLHLAYRTWDLAFSKPLDKSLEALEEARYRKYFIDRLAKTGHVLGTLVDFTTSSYYDAFDSHLIFTQDPGSLDPNRIGHYKDLIRSGKRPFCLIYNSEISDNDNYFVLDGHHKLMAYHNLKIRPSILEITQISAHNPAAQDPNVLSADLFDLMYTWQLKHIFDNGLAAGETLQSIMDSPENRFHAFIKQGMVEEHWINGNLKSKGFYVNHLPEGNLEQFYENGKQKSIVAYQDGRQFRYLKSWFDSGQVQSECLPPNDLLNGTQYSYYKSGALSSKTLFRDGKIADGRSAFSYDEDGRVIYQAEYRDGQSVKSQWFDRDGKLVEER